ncbi:MAG: LuxR C-terminal-related transcriptional regulator [Sphingomonadales bacterium]
MKVLLCFETQLLAEGVLKLLQQFSGNMQFELERPGVINLQRVIDTNCNLILLDMDALKTDAIGLLLEIKKCDPTKKIIFVFEKFEGQVVKAYRNGLDGSFLKNDSTSEVLSALSAVLEGKVYVPQNIIMNILCGGFVFTDLDSRLNQLTQREVTVLEHIASRKSMKEAARILKLAPSTLSAHKQRIMKKLALSNGVEFNNFIRAFEQIKKSPT